MTVLDLSNHDLATLNPVAMQAAGVERVIVGCWDAAATKAIVHDCRAAGIVVEDLYAYIYFGQSWERRGAQNAIGVAREMGGFKRVWLDVEASPPNEVSHASPDYRISVVNQLYGSIAYTGLQVGIYTYEPYWRYQMANTKIFADLPLWLANYGTNDPSDPRDPIREVDFGGWTKVAVHQYSSTIVVAGRNRDHNYWFLEEGDEVTATEYEDLLLALFSGHEEAGLPREERLVNARYRMVERAEGRATSIGEDVAAGFIGLPDHVHEAGKVVRP